MSADVSAEAHVGRYFWYTTYELVADVYFSARSPQRGAYFLGVSGSLIQGLFFCYVARSADLYSL